MASDYGDRLRDAADTIASVAESAPEGDFDEEELAEFEDEFGEVPSIRSVLRDLESATRALAVLTDAHAEGDDG